MNTLRRLPDSELKIMQIVWHGQPPVERSDIERELGGQQLAPSTIITLLNRLCAKGFLKMEKRGRANGYTPLVGEKEYQAAEGRRFLNALYGGSLSAFALALSEDGIPQEELDQLREMLEKGAL